MKVGILGGGQLGLMLAESVHRLNGDVAFFEPGIDSPAEQRCREVTVAQWDNELALARFFDACDVVTYESENIPTAPLRKLPGRLLKKLRPGVDVLEVVQDRVNEKRFCVTHGLPVARHAALASIQDLPNAAEEFGYPFILKTAQGGYDGKGQWRIVDPGDLDTLVPLVQGAPGRFVLEEILQLELEISVVVARSISSDGSVTIEAFPVFENDHREHILDISVVPARVASHLADEAVALAKKAAEALEVVGLLTTEFFVVGMGEEQRLLVNEFAPRTHNSGHLTRRACTLSQFDQLARVLIGLPAATPYTFPGGWAMAQLLGSIWEAQGREGMLDLSRVDLGEHHVAEIYDYGKKAVRSKRKMGHIIAYGPDATTAIDRVRAFRRGLRY